MRSQQKEKIDFSNGMTFLSAFSGCGGADLGFVHEGFTCVSAIDLDKDCVESHRLNIPGPALQADLSSGLPESLKSSSPDVFIAGSPCQGFSNLGKLDRSDPRNSLFTVATQLGIALRPKVVVLENVSSILSPRFRAYSDHALERLRQNGYQATTLVAKASDHGLPQVRTRAITVAWRTGKLMEPELEAVAETVGLREALAGLPEDDTSGSDRLRLSEHEREIARHIPMGKKLSNSRASDSCVHTWQIPSVFGSTTAVERRVLETLLKERRRNRARDWGDADAVPVKRLSQTMGFSVGEIVNGLEKKRYVRRVGQLVDLTHTFNGKFRRLSWNQLVPTVDTRFGQARHFLHPTRVGGFRVREAARLQGFPDSFHFTGDARARFRMIGNAVPVPLARSIARLVRKLCD